MAELKSAVAKRVVQQNLGTQKNANFTIFAQKLVQTKSLSNVLINGHVFRQKAGPFRAILS